MKKYFRIIGGIKFFCEKDGSLEKDDAGSPEVVPTDNTEATEVNETPEGDDDTVAEVEKMILEAVSNAGNKSSKEFDASVKDANESVKSLFAEISKQANETKGVLEVTKTESKLDVEAVKSGLESMKDGSAQGFSFEINSKADLNYLAKSTSEGDLTGDILEVDKVAGVSRDPVRSPFIEQIADVVNMKSESLSYVEVITETGAPATTAELGVISEKDFAFQEFKAPAKKITISNKHSVELLEDAPQLVSAIKGWLQEDLNLVTDTQLLNGDGTGSNLTGVISQATTLTAGTRIDTTATINDVLRIAITEIAGAGKGKFRATHIVLHPDDVEALDLAKDSNENYIIPPFRSADGQIFKGARIIENTGITSGDFLIGDFKKLHVGRKGGVRIEMTNSDGTDFAKDILTVKMVRRVASYVRANDSGAFYTGTIATIITDLAT